VTTTKVSLYTGTYDECTYCFLASFDKAKSVQYHFARFWLDRYQFIRYFKSSRLGRVDIGGERAILSQMAELSPL